ncbi:hypothetical protein Asp14428_04160 [Actinoplanes sp. NBRC 14428]|uniref:Putative adhesin n=1 Tax=Pseudosporangium ferrugineum TaxID=439699 RepID=A0A2T0SI31_9ACTN|nr:DUF4097 family beta strand repeat-containing protein [Pseudosporangium ferrugineum]PRY33076.1 putative adhesin [Pseudosporangium ferrugineum]BCJ48941.1 hypothetical protein Asp14428_04160 [Actinoplanes sp. NBRC 14428]
MPAFESPGPITATLELEVGDAQIAAADRPDTVVEVRPTDPGSDRDVRAAEQTRVEYADGRLLVKTPKPRNLGLFGRPGSVDVRIALPTGSRVRADAAVSAFHCTGILGETRIKTATGDVRVEHSGVLDLNTAAGTIVVETADGDVHAATASGAVHLGSVAGSAVVRNSHGDSRIGRVAGELRVNAANGDILVGQAGGDVTATTANGSIRVDEVRCGVVSVKTAAGSVQVGVARGTAAYLDLHTSFGRMRNGLDAGGAPEPGESSVEVRARTSFGDITVVRAHAGDVA